MHTIRFATEEDAELIALQRRRMFEDNTPPIHEDWDQVERAFAAWVKPRLADKSYVSWLAEEEGNVIAGAAVWFMDFPPHWIDVQPKRAYLLNFYTAPEARGRGIAKEMVSLAVAEAQRRGVKAVILHASRFGKPIYEKLGFEVNNEMMRILR